MPVFAAPETWESDSEIDEYEPVSPQDLPVDGPLSPSMPECSGYSVVDELAQLLEDVDIRNKFLQATQNVVVGKQPIYTLEMEPTNVESVHDTFADLSTSHRTRILTDIHSESEALRAHADHQQSRRHAESESMLSAIRQSFSTMADLSMRIVAAEAERKFQISEEIRKQKEEKQRHLEEAARKKREEEEREKKEEEERQKKLAIEVKQREAEAKLKAQKDKEEAEAKAKADATAKAKQAAEKIKEAAIAEAEAKKTGKGITNFTMVEKDFLAYKKTIAEIKSDIVEPLLANKELKSACYKLRRQINPKFGQLNNSLTQLAAITEVVTTAVSQAKQANELAFKWILNYIAKAIVVQAGTEVVTAPDRAVPLSKLALNLTVMFPELRHYLLARFVKKCPLVIGYTCAVDTEEGRLRMAWKRSSAGKWEEETQYNERIGGIFTVFAVLTRLQLQPNQPQGVFPYPMALGWTMMARILNMPADLLANVHYLAASNWWDAAAEEFLKAYGRQGQKLLQLMWDEWTLRAREREFAGAARLRIVGEAWANSGRVESFKPMER